MKDLRNSGRLVMIHFIDQVLSDMRVDAVVKQYTLMVLVEVCAVAPRMEPPTVVHGDDGRVILTWRSDIEYMTLDVFIDGHVDIFHEDSYQNVYTDTTSGRLTETMLQTVTVMAASIRTCAFLSEPMT